MHHVELCKKCQATYKTMQNFYENSTTELTQHKNSRRSWVVSSSIYSSRSHEAMNENFSSSHHVDLKFIAYTEFV